MWYNILLLQQWTAKIFVSTYVRMYEKGYKAKD